MTTGLPADLMARPAPTGWDRAHPQRLTFPRHLPGTRLSVPVLIGRRRSSPLPFRGERESPGERAFAVAHGELAAYRDATPFEIAYGRRLRRTETSKLDVVAFGRNPQARRFGRYGTLNVRCGKAKSSNHGLACGTAAHHRSDAHDAFYAAKRPSVQAGFAEILSKRLRLQGVRVISPKSASVRAEANLAQVNERATVVLGIPDLSRVTGRTVTTDR
jgi:hypothetical protein